MANRTPRPYPEYKDSGVEWLGEIPAHWNVKKLKRCVAVTGGMTPSMAVEAYWNGSIPWVTPKDMKVEAIDDSAIRVTEAAVHETSLTVVDSGAVLMVVRGMILAKAVPVAWTTCRVTINQDMKALRPLRGVNERFLGRALAATQEALLSLVDVAGHGSRRLPTDRWLALPLAIPPRTEQEVILDFLDRETAKIDELLARQERLIDLLQEKRTALITRAVTLGLDPNVPMKESGVEWLGEIPAHWGLQRLRTLANITTGGRDTVDRQEGGEYPFFVRSPTVERIDTWSFDGEAVLTAGDGVGVAKVFHYVNGKFDFHQRVYKFSGFEEVVGKFFYHYFGASLRFETMRGTAKSTVDSLRLPMLQNFPVVVPPLAEQDAILVHVERESARLDAAIAKTKSVVRRLDEYRAALISAAVTGGIDVRNRWEGAEARGIHDG